jgi:hypothetical protein
VAAFASASAVARSRPGSALSALNLYGSRRQLLEDERVDRGLAFGLDGRRHVDDLSGAT